MTIQITKYFYNLNFYIMNNAKFITSIGNGLNMSGFITPGYQKVANDELQKGELTDSLRYDNNIKYTKTGKEIKAALTRAKSAYQLKKDDIANQMSILKEKLPCKPFSPVSTWQMRGFEKQMGLQFNYPYEFFRFIENKDSGEVMPSYNNNKVTVEDICGNLNKRYACTLTTDCFPTTPETSEPYYQYNRLVDEYITHATDCLQLDIMIKNLNDKKTFELSQSQMLALDQYMDNKVDNLEKGIGGNGDLEKGGVGSGKHKGVIHSMKEQYKIGNKVKAHIGDDHVSEITHSGGSYEAMKKEGYDLPEPETHSDYMKGKGSKNHYVGFGSGKEKFAMHHSEIDHAASKLDNLKKAYDTLGFDENFNDIEKADNEGGDSQAIMHTNGSDPVDVSDLVIVSGNDHWVDVIDPATGKPRFKSGDKVKYKLEDDGTKYKGTIEEEKHPIYDQALKVKHNKKKEVEVG